MVRHALRDFATILRDNPDFHISVNVTAGDLSDPAFLPMLQQLLERGQVKPQSVILEITESSTAKNAIAVETIATLRQAGHCVHIDDFGTGYSSLSYLHALCVDAIKIDKSFTQAIGTDAVTFGILPQIISMAEALNLEVVVEGIETEQQAAYFRALERPVLAQGWLFGRPIAAEAFQRQLDQAYQEPVLAMHGSDVRGR